MSLSGVVPLSSTYRDGGLPLALESKRREVKVLPQQGADMYSPEGNSIIRIDLSPSLQFLDVSNSYLCFEMSVDADTIDPDKPCRMDKSAASFIRRFELIGSGGQVLESIDDYNLLSNLLHAATSPDDYKSSIGRMIDNQANQCERNGFTVNKKGRVYCCGFDCSGILGSNQKYLPLQFMNGSLTIELTLAPFNDCFVGFRKSATSADPTYNIKNVYYQAACISFGMDYNQIFESKLRSDGVSIHFHSYRTHHHTLTSTSQTVFQISQASKSVKGIYTCIRDKDKYRSPRHDSLSTYKSGGLSQYQFDLGGALYPLAVQNVADSGSTRAYSSMLNSFNVFRDHSAGTEIGLNNYNASQTGETRTRGPAKWKGNVTKSINGVMYAGINIDAKSSNPSAGATASGYFFVPDDLRELQFWNVGEKIKINFERNLASSTLADASSDDLGYKNASAPGANLAKITTSAIVLKSGADKTDDQKKEVDQGLFMYVVGVGCRDINIYSGTNDTYTASLFQIPCIQLQFMKETIDDSGRYLLPDFSSGAQGTLVGDQADSEAALGTDMNLGFPFINSANDTDSEFQGLVDNGFQIRPGASAAQNNSKTLTAGISCTLNLIPDDSKFFISQSFETHHENSRLISGSDQTQSVPLHLNLKWDALNEQSPNDSVKSGDMMSSFLHYDSVLHIDQVGEVTASQ